MAYWISNLPAGGEVLGYPVLGSDSEVGELAEQHSLEGVVVAIGDNHVRSQVVASVTEKAPQLKFPSVVHPSAQIAKGVQIWRGSVIMPGVVVNSGTQIGEFCILNTNCSVDHDGVLGDFSSFAPNSCAGGTVHIGEFSAVSLGANLIHNVKVGSHSVIGAGATVVSDLPSNVVAYTGHPRALSEVVSPASVTFSWQARRATQLAGRSGLPYTRGLPARANSQASLRLKPETRDAFLTLAGEFTPPGCL